MSILVISSSLNLDSSTLHLARHVLASLERQGHPAALLDLAGREMPWCDGFRCYESAHAQDLAAIVRAASAIIICTPIYNFSVNAALKNFIELTDQAWNDKVVGFACSAGGPSSYMAIMSAANWLMLDFRCVIVPRFVYATRQAFTERVLTDEEVARRLDELAAAVVRFGAAMALPTTNPPPAG